MPPKQGSLIYLNTASIAATLERVTRCGGTILFPRTAAGDFGYVAEFEDCEGNRVALFEEG